MGKLNVQSSAIFGTAISRLTSNLEVSETNSEETVKIKQTQTHRKGKRKNEHTIE
jgi:hypothetical protein